MRRLGTAAGLTAVLVLVVVAFALANASSSPFVGSWSSTDPVDGSAQHLSVTGGTNVDMDYIDEYGTTCIQLNAPTVVFTGHLTGRVDGDDLLAVFKQGGCGPTQEVDESSNFRWTFHYDRATDTLFGAIEDGPATWYRD